MITHVKHFKDLTIEELYDILRLRAEVFVVEQDCPYQDLDGRDRNAWHVWLEESGKAVACLRVFMFDELHSQIGRVVTSLDVRGKGAGRLIMEEGVKIAEEHFPDFPILIHAQAYATGFYEKFGFRISSDAFLEDGIPHHEMIRPTHMIEINENSND